MNLRELSEPFPQENVHWRVQGTPFARQGEYFAMALAYIDARDVMDRLDEVCGSHCWQSEFFETASGRVVCRLGIKIGDEWVWKSDGAGGTQVEAEKGGMSDALKRAAVNWGIGRYLYRMDSVWLKCEVRMKDGKPTLNNGKLVWKKWLEDPWSKVKAPVRNVPEQFDHGLFRDRVKKMIEGAYTFTGLKKTWEDNAQGLKRLEAEKPPMYSELVKAKDDRKKELTPPDDPAGQAPADMHGYQ